MYIKYNSQEVHLHMNINIVVLKVYVTHIFYW